MATKSIGTAEVNSAVTFPDRKNPCPRQTEGFIAEAFLGACKLSMQTDPPVAKAGGSIKGLTERLARRSCESEAGPREPGITHHPAQSYSNMKRQGNQSF